MTRKQNERVRQYEFELPTPPLELTPTDEKNEFNKLCEMVWRESQQEGTLELWEKLVSSSRGESGVSKGLRNKLKLVKEMEAKTVVLTKKGWVRKELPPDPEQNEQEKLGSQTIRDPGNGVVE